jgi:sugar/nucleoside kinase (ribokinase family)
MSILVLGTVALDTIQTPYGKREGILGGSAAHFSLVARLFDKVHLVAVIGRDFPYKYIRLLKEKGINLDSLSKASGDTFHWKGIYEGDLNTAHTLKTHLGVLSDFQPKITDAQKKIRHIFLANVDPHIQRHLLERISSPCLVGLDSMNYWIRHSPKALLKILKKIDIFVANDQEVRQLSGETNLVKAAKYIYTHDVKMVLIKKGEHGVLFFSKDFIFTLPAYPVEKVIDPTGAGDSFAGGFMGYLAKAKKINAKNIKKALAYGTVAASFNVEGFGVERTARLKLEDIEKRLMNFRSIIA